MSEEQKNTDEIDLTKFIDTTPSPNDMRNNIIFVSCIIGIIAVIIFIGNPQQKLIVSDQQLDDAAIQRAGQQRPIQDVAGAVAEPFGPSGGPTPTPPPVVTVSLAPTVEPTVSPTQTPVPTNAPSNNDNSNPTNTPTPQPSESPTAAPTEIPSPSPESTPTQ